MNNPIIDFYNEFKGEPEIQFVRLKKKLYNYIKYIRNLGKFLDVPI